MNTTGRRGSRERLLAGALVLGGALLWSNSVVAQGPDGAKAPVRPPTLGLDGGTMALETPDFRLRLVTSSQTVAALVPKSAADFDFTPADQLEARSANGFYHLGDLTLRVRLAGTEPWRTLSTADDRKPVKALPVTGATLAAADLGPTLPPDSPLRVTRSWSVEDGALVLRFALTNGTATPVEIGGLGMPLIFNNYITDRTLEQAHAICSFSDPAIGLDAGYVQVTRLTGHGPALLVVPEGRTPLEAYRPLLDDLTRRTQTFEGFYEWTTHSRAYAEDEWKGVDPWNPPTAATVGPGETRIYGVRFLLSDSIRSIEATLGKNRRPVAVGIPGYVLPTDLDASLFLKHSSPVRSVEVVPQGAIEVAAGDATAGGWATYRLRGQSWGRARLTVTYQDGLRQSIHYRVIKPASQAVADLGRFLTHEQWFVRPQDPFHRSPSVMSYDRETNRIVEQDSRVWIAGLGDEGGSGSWLAGAMKLLGQPEPEEVGKYQQFIDGVLWGRLQYADGPNKCGVRKSLFYYEPKEMPAGFYDTSSNWGSWTSWNRAKTEIVDRSFNYPHVVATYWTFYRLARNNVGVVSNHSWEWYLTRAYETTLAMERLAPYYARFGHMEGTVFVELLQDLRREGWKDEAGKLEDLMRKRTDRWNAEMYPFGSEMAWDSTGQEEVYAWTRHFGYSDKAKVTLGAILGYMPTVPHWGYNGNTRRYWDFLYGGKIRRIERQIHHYGSSLNALPLLTAYRDNPEDFHLLRVGYGGTLGVLTNIDQEGFASAAFHAWPQTLAFDAYSGDYGPGFLGHALATATYLVRHPEFGWLAFGGNVRSTGSSVELTPLDSFRSRVFVAPLGLWLTLDAGRFAGIEVDPSRQTVRVGLDASTSTTPQALLRLEQPGAPKGVGRYSPTQKLELLRDAYRVPLGAQITWITLTPDAGAATSTSSAVSGQVAAAQLEVK